MIAGLSNIGMVGPIKNRKNFSDITINRFRSVISGVPQAQGIRIDKKSINITGNSQYDRYFTYSHMGIDKFAIETSQELTTSQDAYTRLNFSPANGRTCYLQASAANGTSYIFDIVTAALTIGTGDGDSGTSYCAYLTPLFSTPSIIFDATAATPTILIGRGGGRGTAVSATPVAGTISGTYGSGSNISAAGLNIVGGKGTGTGSGGDICFKVALPGSSGSSLNTLSTIGIISGSTGAVSFTSPLATTVPLTITGAASQSANITEWKNSSSTVLARITSAGEFSNPSTGGTNSEAFGAGSIAKTNGLSIGYLCVDSSASGRNILIGNNISVSTGVNNIAIAMEGLSIGTVSSSIIIARGDGLSGLASNQCIIGGPNQSITDVYFGKGPNNSSPSGVIIHSTSANGTNIAGASLGIEPGVGTGTGISGDLNFRIALPTTSSSTRNTPVTVGSFSGTTGGLTLTTPTAATIPFTITGAASQTANLINVTASGGSAGGLLAFTASGRLNIGGTTIDSFGRHVNVVSTTPGIGLYESDVTTDEKGWDMAAAASTFSFRCFNDALNAASNIFTVTRSGYVPNHMKIFPALEVSSYHYTTYTNNGNSGAAKTIDWSASPVQRITLDASCTLTFTAPNGISDVLLHITQNGTGGYSVTWPASVKWAGGTAPTITTTAGAVSVVRLFYDGATYWGDYTLDVR